MCGLVLALNRGPQEVVWGLEVMSYRGAPDAELSVECAGPWTIGHVRLPLTTGEGGEQPFPMGGGRIGAFVGEIFSSKSRSSRGLSEIDLMSLPEDRFYEFDGFWAFVKANNTGHAYVFTDYLGVKPLYYWAEEGIVASEPKALFSVAGYAPRLDELYLSNCIKFGYDYSGRTAWEGVFQLPPGYCLPLSPYGHLSNSPGAVYWDWEEAYRVQKGEGDFVDDFLRVLKNRVQVADPDRSPVGVLLSGGLDSSLVYYGLKHLGMLDQVSLYHHPNEDDSDYLPDDGAILNLATSCQTPERVELVSAMQAPLDLGSLEPQYKLAQAMGSHGIRVVLTGDGADELFGGYSRIGHYDSQASDVFCELPYYHLPRLDRIHMRFTQELRSPFISPVMIARALKLPLHQRTHKKVLKGLGEFLGVPQRVLDRPKEALKSTAVREGGLSYRNQLVETFRAQQF